VPVADRHVQVAEDAIEMDQVELFERLAVTGLRELDELAHSLLLGDLLAGLGLNLGHGFTLPLAHHLVTQPPAPKPTRLSRAWRLTNTIERTATL